MKKLLLTFILASSIFGIIACCNEIPEFFVINEFEVIAVDSLGSVPPNHEFSEDSLRLQLNLDGEAIVENNYADFFINSTTATSCPEPGYRGLQDPIRSLEIITLNPFNQFSANSDISSIVRIEEWDGISISEYIQQLNQSPIWLLNSNLIITEKPVNQTEHQFQVQIEFESGRILTQETAVIRWL